MVDSTSIFTKNTFISLLSSKTGSSGVVEIALPPVSGTGVGHTVVGFMADDFTMNLGTTWGSVLPDAETANEIGQILGYQNIITWIQSSAAAWKGTQPIEFDMTVYLITIERNQTPSIVEEAKSIMKMLALYVENNDLFTAKVHGGYSVDYFQTNRSSILDNFTKHKESKDISEEGYHGFISGMGQSLLSSQKGLIQLYVNRQMCIRDLLLTKAQITQSSSYIDARTPLFIKMELGFRGFRSPTVADIENIYR